MSARPTTFPSGTDRSRGSVLIIVMWICLGLVALTLYFANSMSSELRAAGNRVSEVAARQAVAGGTRYAAYVLTNFATGGAVPPEEDYKAEALPVGDASFWFIGRDNDQPSTVPKTEPHFALIDESSKLNLNTATRTMLMALPNMTTDLADAILSWKTATGTNSANADNTYAQFDPPRHNKGAPFETIDELRLVNGATLDLLLGEDTNRNGVLDANEDDGDQSAPHDNQDGQLLAGILEYVTVYSKQPIRGASGSRRIDVGAAMNGTSVATRLQGRGVEQGRAQQVGRIVNTRTFGSVLEFMVASQLTADEFALVHTEFMHGTTAAQGLVNVNTASETVLDCIPGIGTDNAAAVVAYRLAHPDLLTSFAWLKDVLSAASVRLAGPYITDQSYQFSADIAAVGVGGRGYCREKVVFDTSTGTPRIIFHQDLTAYGWALGADAQRTARERKDI